MDSRILYCQYEWHHVETLVSLDAYGFRPESMRCSLRTRNTSLARHVCIQRVGAHTFTKTIWMNGSPLCPTLQRVFRSHACNQRVCLRCCWAVGAQNPILLWLQGSLLLAAGSPGERRSLPNARIMIHQPSGGYSVCFDPLYGLMEKSEHASKCFQAIYRHLSNTVRAFVDIPRRCWNRMNGRCEHNCEHKDIPLDINVCQGSTDSYSRSTPFDMISAGNHARTHADVPRFCSDWTFLKCSAEVEVSGFR